jgi:hypothetical protein
MNVPTLGNPNAMDGIFPDNPHFDRTELLEKLLVKVERNLFTLLSSSAASGKTSLLCLFSDAVKTKCNVTYISCNEDKQLNELFLLSGVNLNKQSYCSPFNNGLPHVIILDDAQKTYDDSSWGTLIKGMPFKLSNCRIIISAVHSLESGVESPVYFSNSQKLTRNDFLLSPSESLTFLSDEKIGLRGTLSQFSILKEVIARECGGLIGALALCCKGLNSHFQKFTVIQESEALRYFFSNTITELMERCFGSGHSRPVSNDIADFLERSMIGDESVLWIQTLEQKGDPIAKKLLESGILEEESYQVKFSSRMAERYYFRCLFPTRSSDLPQTLPELVKNAITLLPFNVLQNSVDDGNFPKEAVFQLLFMSALISCTPPSVAIHPELSQPFGSNEKIPGEIDFYIDGELRWGIELLTNGDRKSEHMDRFGPNGKYAGLGVTDYAVVDFRKLIDGKPTNVQRHEKRYTAFFDPKDFSKCFLYSGTENVIELNLSR